MSRQTKVTFKLLDLLVMFVMIFSAPMSALAAPSPTGATIASDQPDYVGGSIVTLTGTGWAAGESVQIVTNDTIGQTWKRDVTVTADEFGNVTDIFSLPTYFVSDYDVTATGPISGSATATFTDAPPDLQNLWQCDPPSTFNPGTYTCVNSSATGWVTGNNDGPFKEGETVPYRTRMQNLVNGNNYSVTIQWDTTKDDKHALDYLRSFNATITAADPCLSVGNPALPAGLCSGSPSTIAIPQDTFMQADANWNANVGVQNPGVFTMFGGTLTSVSAYTTPGSYLGDTSTSITVFFTANSTNSVLAWGGHIASRDDWGLGNSAVAISGSPYHMRILSWFDVTNNTGLNVGNTDRSLSADAVIFPASITIIKQATPEGSTSFPFTASPSPLTNFNLVDNGTAANTQTFSNITNFQNYSVTENVPSSWALNNVVCTVSGGVSTTPPSTSTATVVINLKEGDNVVCTFNDQIIFVPNPHLSITKEATETGFSAVGDIIHYTIVATNDGNTTLAAVTVTDPNASGLTCTPANGSSLAPGASMNCTASHTITQADIDAGSFYNQACVDDGAGGAAQACDDVTTPGTRTPHLSITKVATESGYDAVGQVIHYTIVATNDGNTTLAAVAVTDPNVSDLDCTPVNGSPLIPGASMTCTASHIITQADLEAGSFYNQACVDDGAGGAAEACDDVTTPGTQTPHLTISKVATEGGFDSIGDVIHYTIVATNDGNVTLHNVVVTDAQVTDLACDAVTDLAPGASINCTASHTITQADLDAGSFYNQACVDDGAGGAAAACDDVTTPGTKTPHLSITKTDDGDTYDSVGDVIDYTIHVVNDGNTTLHNVTVTDPNADNLNCLPGNGIDLAPGDEMNCTASHTVTQEDIDAGSYLNAACVDDGADGAAEACDEVTTPGDKNPHLTITKIDDGDTYDSVGDVIDYTIVATNDGNVTLHNLLVTDANADNLNCTEGNPVADLAPGDSIHCTASHEVTQEDIDAGSYFNAACVDVDDGDGISSAIEACDNVTTPGDQNPSISINKTTNGSDGVVIPVGSSITWTYVVTNTGNVSLSNIIVVDDSGTPANPADDFSPSCPKTTLVPGESMTCTAGGTAVAGHYINTGATTGNPPTGNPVTDTDESDYFSTPRLIVIKHVVKNNGGSATAANFTLDSGGTSDTPDDFAGSELGTTVTLDAGSYAVTETGPSGYTRSDSADCAGTIANGETKTCTVTNDDNAPSLTLNKVVVNDNGGTAAESAWTLTANGGTAGTLSGPGATGNADVVSGSTFKAGTYALSESAGPSGYSASSWSCVKNSGSPVTGSSITLGLGDSATCTITNDDIAPKLHLRKIVTNDNGGTKTVADFTLTANGAGSNDLSGTSPVDSGASLQADTWALSETNVYGYTASAWSCVGGTQSGSSITVGIGGEATCTITNDDKPGTIIVQKVIKPVGSLTSFSFNTTGTGYTNFSLSGGQTNTQTPLNAGTYTVKELVPLGWVLTGIGGSTDVNTPYNCTVTGSGGSTGVGDLNTQIATISLKNGDTVTCVFENTGQGVTRTQGFWATHPQLANIAWFGGTAFGHTFPGVAGVSGIGDKTLCGRPIDTLGKLMGGFWSSVSTKSTGVKRTALDQARMQLLQQLLAAELNASAFGTVPSSGSFAAWESAYCGTNQNTIKNALQQAASFNTNGDSATFTPGTSADSKSARANANYVWWDSLP